MSTKPDGIPATPPKRCSIPSNTPSKSLPRPRRQSERLTPGKGTSRRGLLDASPTTTKPAAPTETDSGMVRLQRLINQMPLPTSAYTVQKHIGQGTFSTVYLATLKNDAKEEFSAPSTQESTSREINKQVALKHIIPTSGPDRILMEVIMKMSFFLIPMLL